jgi:hypothetical protein
MHSRTHLWTSALAGLLAYPRRPAQALLVVATGVLVDVDHFVLYALRSGDWSLRGALRYNQYRNKPRGPRDQRPRYGSLRSVVHHPLAVLGLVLLAKPVPALRPVALGFGLHMLLDWAHIPGEWLLFQQVGWRCELCGGNERLRLRLIVHPTDGGRNRPDNRVVLCRRCDYAASLSYPQYPPPRELRATVEVPALEP